MPAETTHATSTQEPQPAPSHEDQTSAASEDSLDKAFRSMLDPIEQQINAIAARLDGSNDGKTAGTDHTPSTDSIAELQTQQSFIFKALDDLSGKVDRLLENTAPPAEPEPPEAEAEVVEEPSPADTRQRWGRVVLGEALNSNETVSDARQQLLDDTLEGSESAVGLAARIMLVHTASPADLPPLLKELGEAYYRWHPKHSDTPDKMEEVLVAWLHDRISAAGLRNRIDVVRVGDQYDTSRHISSQRGIEVSEVSGWVVLRDNGRTLSKAKVSLK